MRKGGLVSKNVSTIELSAWGLTVPHFHFQSPNNKAFSEAQRKRPSAEWMGGLLPTKSKLSWDQHFLLNQGTLLFWRTKLSQSSLSCPVGKEVGLLLHSDQNAGPLALARVRVTNTPGRILKWGPITCSVSSTWTPCHRCPPSFWEFTFWCGILWEDARERWTYIFKWMPCYRTNPPNISICFLKRRRTCSCSMERDPPTLGHWE